MTKKEIEKYINTYRVYPPEYTGKRDPKILYTMGAFYRVNVREQTITRYEGKINDNGDFELVGIFTFPIDNPEAKTITRAISFNSIITSYNQLMTDLGYEDRLITPGSKRESWNLRDLVSEVEYIRSLYYTKGHERNKLKVEDPSLFNKHTSRLRYFLRANKPYIDNLVVTEQHNSKYDNMEVVNE